MLQALDAVEGRIGLGGDDAHPPVHPLQVTARAHQRARGAQGGDEVGDAALGVAPDFRAGGGFVRLGVGRVVVLIRLEVAVGIGLEDFARLEDGAVGALQRIGEDELGAKGAADALALVGDVARHDQPHAVAQRRADHRQRDAGVAAGGVEDDLVRRQQAALDAVAHHHQRWPILDRAAGIEALQLGLQHDVFRQVRGDALQPGQRSVADEIENVQMHTK